MLLGLRLDEPLALEPGSVARWTVGPSSGSSGPAAERLSRRHPCAHDARSLSRRRRHRGAPGLKSPANDVGSRPRLTLVRSATRAFARRRRGVRGHRRAGRLARLVERTGLRLAVDRAQRAGRLEAFGLLTHPHTSAGRGRPAGLPRRCGGRLDQLEPQPGGVPLDLAGARSEVEDAAAGDDRDALGRDAAACSRLGAAPGDGDRPPRRGPEAPAPGGDGRRDHFDRRRDEAALPLRRAGRPGPRELGGAVPERAESRACSSGARFCAGGSTTRLSARASGFLERSRPPSPSPAPGAAPLRRRRRGPARGRAPRSSTLTSGLLEALEKRAALLDVLAQALDPRRPFVRVGQELDTRRCATSRSSAPPTASRTGRSAP